MREWHILCIVVVHLAIIVAVRAALAVPQLPLRAELLRSLLIHLRRIFNGHLYARLVQMKAADGRSILHTGIAL